MPGAFTSSGPDGAAAAHPAFRSPRRGRAAFSLIEVALALGVISFCVVPLLVLMSVGLRAGKSSQQDTALALAAKYIVSDLRRQPFSALTDRTYVFDFQGLPTFPAAVSTQAGFYTGSVTLRRNPLADAAAWDAKNDNLVGVRIAFSWPGQTNGGAHVPVFQTSLAGY